MSENNMERMLKLVNCASTEDKVYVLIGMIHQHEIDVEKLKQETQSLRATVKALASAVDLLGLKLEKEQ